VAATRRHPPAHSGISGQGTSLQSPPSGMSIWLADEWLSVLIGGKGWGGSGIDVGRASIGTIRVAPTCGNSRGVRHSVRGSDSRLVSCGSHPILPHLLVRVRGKKSSREEIAFADNQKWWRKRLFDNHLPRAARGLLWAADSGLTAQSTTIILRQRVLITCASTFASRLPCGFINVERSCRRFIS